MRHLRAPSEFCQHTRDFLTGLVIFIIVFAIAALDPRPARPAEAEVTGPAVAAPAGSLLMPGADTETLSTDIRITVTGGIARASVSQSFRYAGEDAARGLYLFPLPEAASVDRFELRVGSRTFHSKVVPTRAARRPAVPAPADASSPAVVPASVSAAAAPRLPGELPGHMFALAVGNVAPGDVITVRFEYQQTLKPVSGIYSLRFPLSPDTPRAGRAAPVRNSSFAVAGAADPAGDILRRVNLSVRLAPGFDIGDIASFNHQMAVRRLSDRDAVLVLTGDTLPAGRDLELAWAPKSAGLPETSLFVEETGGAAYALAMIAPPGEPARQPRELILLLDASGSMTGAAFDQARDVVVAALGRLDRHDRFNVIAFNDGLHPLFETARDANPTSVAAAEDFLRRIKPRGGGDMLAAVSAGLREGETGDRTHLRQIVAVTDGAISTGNEFFAEIAARRGKSRLFIAGIGAAPDPLLLQRTAQIGRGDAIHIAERGRTGELLARLLARIERPAITDLKIVWPTGAKLELSSEPLPDIYAGEPLMAAFRAATAKGKITLSGRIGGKPWTADLHLSAATPATGIAAHWAQVKITRIEAQRLAGKPAQETAEAIETLALAHGLTSPVTKLVAVSAGAETTDAPAIAVRQGLRSPGMGYDLRKQLIAAARSNVSPVADEADVAAQMGQGRTDYLTVLALSLVFASMTALTFALWRHLRRSVAPAEASPRRRRGWRSQLR